MQRRLCSAILLLQAIVLGLTTPVLVHDDDLTKAQGLWVGLGLCVGCLLVAGLLRARWAYALGWVIQVASLALGLVTPVMIVLGVVFGTLWLTAVRLGAMIDRDKAAAAAAGPTG